MKNHMKKKTSLGWSIPEIIFRNPLVVFLFMIHRYRKTSEPVFLTKFDLKREGLEQPRRPIAIHSGQELSRRSSFSIWCGNLHYDTRNAFITSDQWNIGWCLRLAQHGSHIRHFLPHLFLSPAAMGGKTRICWLCHSACPGPGRVPVPPGPSLVLVLVLVPGPPWSARRSPTSPSLTWRTGGTGGRWRRTGLRLSRWCGLHATCHMSLNLECFACFMRLHHVTCHLVTLCYVDVNVQLESMGPNNIGNMKCIE